MAPKQTAVKEVKDEQNFQYVVLGGPERELGFDILDELGEATHYKPGDVFVPAKHWQELPPTPDDGPDTIKFSVPYIINPEAKRDERVTNWRTVILRLQKVAVTKE